MKKKIVAYLFILTVAFVFGGLASIATSYVTYRSQIGIQFAKFVISTINTKYKGSSYTATQRWYNTPTYAWPIADSTSKVL